MSNRAHAVTETLSAPLDTRRLWTVGVLAAGGLLGLIAGIQPQFALAAILAAAFVPIVFAWPLVGLCTLVFLSFLESFSGITGSFSLTKVVGVLLVLAWVGTVATASPAERARYSLIAREPLLAAALVLFVAWAGMSLVWAERPASGADAVSRFALNFVLFPITLAAVRKPRHIVVLFAVFVAAALTSVAIGVLRAPAADPTGEGRLTGVGLNPNQLGALLIVAVVLAATLAMNRRWSPLMRFGALAAAAVAAINLYMTQSRGALVGLGLALVVAPLVAGRGRRAGALVLVVATLVATIGWFAVVAPASAVERVTHPTTAGGSGREDLWTVGLRMVDDHPLRGVGAGNFRVSSIDYLLRPGRTQRDEYIVDTPKVPHNIYLAVLSELGAVGLVLFGVILGSALRSALRAAQTFARRGEPTMELLARGLLISLVGYLAALFFSSQIYDKQLWLLLATAPAMLAIAERGVREDGRRVAPLTRLRGVHVRAGR